MVKVADYEIQEDYYYTDRNIWVKVEEDGTARIGITDYAQKMLREAMYFELPEGGTTIKQFERFGAFQSVKTYVDLYAPISGVVKEINPETKERPTVVNTDPYEKGWLISVQPSNLQKELKKIMDWKSFVEWNKKKILGI